MRRVARGPARVRLGLASLIPPEVVKAPGRRMRA